MNKLINLGFYFNKNKNYIDLTSNFHPSGKKVSDLEIKKNLYKYQVRKNICSFKIDETIKKWSGSFTKYKGFVLVFPSQNSDSILEDIKYIQKSIFEILYKHKNKIIYKPGKDYFEEVLLEHNFFGKYILNDSISFDKNSISIEINGISDNTIIKICENISIKSFIIKNLNTNKIYFFNK